MRFCFYGCSFLFKYSSYASVRILLTSSEISIPFSAAISLSPSLRLMESFVQSEPEYLTRFTLMAVFKSTFATLSSGFAMSIYV